ncbi:MAG: helix-turn-helix domain-containing protein, partial [Bdellovibrio sp.]
HQAGEKIFSAEAENFLLSCEWWGNVRELENTVERAVVLGGEPILQTADLQTDVEERSRSLRSLFDDVCQKEGRLLSLDELSQHYISYVLQINQGAREKTAKDLGIDRKTLYRRLHAPAQ